MRIAKQTVLFLLVGGIPLWIMGCAVRPVPYPVHLRYPAELITAPLSPVISETIGLQAFENISAEHSMLGRRETGWGTEFYESRPNPIADAFTEAAENFLRHKGYALRSISGWDYTPESLPRVGEGLDTVVAGKIRDLFCKAEKKFARTTMVLEADIVFIIGDVKLMKVTTRPVKIRLERTEISFDAQKLEHFMNDTLADLLQTGLGKLP